MVCKYAYIDNEEKEAKKNIASINIISPKKFKVEFIRPEDWKTFTDTESIKKILNKYDGILIDFRLDNEPVTLDDGTNFHTNYSGLALAQRIREVISFNKDFKDIPLVIISTDKYIESYNKEFTGHDLFIWKYLKKNLTNTESIETLIELSNGYKQIEACKSNLVNFEEIKNKLFKCTADYLNDVVENSINNLPENHVHARAYYILKKIVLQNGLLISEPLLAARLGIDIQKSKEWETLKNKFKNFKYNGIFSKLESKYWEKGFTEWWFTQISKNSHYLPLTSNQRVEMIKEKTKISDIKPIQEYEVQMGKLIFKGRQNYNTICKVTGLPISSEDAFMIFNPDLENWQYPEFVFIPAHYFPEKFNKAKKFEYRIDPREKLKEEMWEKRIDG